MLFVFLCQKRFLIKIILLPKYTHFFYGLIRVLNFKIVDNDIKSMSLIDINNEFLKRGQTDRLDRSITGISGNSISAEVARARKMTTFFCKTISTNGNSNNNNNNKQQQTTTTATKMTMTVRGSMHSSSSNDWFRGQQQQHRSIPRTAAAISIDSVDESSSIDRFRGKTATATKMTMTVRGSTRSVK